MKRYSVARRQSVGSPRTERCNVPSGFKSFGPTTAASGCPSAYSIETLQAVRDDPGIGVEEEEVATAGRAHAGVVAAAHPTVLLLDHAHLRKPFPHELERAVARAVVDHDHLLAAHGLEALLQPRQRVPGDDDDRCVSHCAREPAPAGRRRSPRGSRRGPGPRAGSSSRRRGTHTQTLRRPRRSDSRES